MGPRLIAGSPCARARKGPGKSQVLDKENNMIRARAAVAGPLLAFAITMMTCCQGAEGASKMQKLVFGKTADGMPIDEYVLTNQRGMEAAIINFGATLVALKVPDRAGQLADVVLGYDDLAGYANGKSYFGGTIGRYGNRIAHGTFQLDGVSYHVPLNDGENSLHGGTVGFNKRIWTAKEVSTGGAEALELTYLSKDGEEGYPGNLSVKVIYTLAADRNELRIDYSATTDKDTVLNLTNHSYFNLAGQGEGDILAHQVRINARQFTPVNATLIPTGELREVKGTPFDFTQATAIGARIGQDDQQLKLAKGYDHNWVLDKTGGKGGLVLAAEVYEPKSGRDLQVLTTEPGVQFYSGNFLDGTVTGKKGKVYQYRFGFCLETQHFPDSPNHPQFPSTELKAGQPYQTATVFKFSTQP
jgi:aldose 1-epimerase